MAMRISLDGNLAIGETRRLGRWRRGPLKSRWVQSAAGGSDPVQALTDIAHTAFDLTAEGFADSTAIATLTDQTGNGRNATQATEAKKPSAQTVSGMKVARLNGDTIATAAFGTPVTQAYTVVMCLKLTALSGYIFDAVAFSNRGLMYISGSNYLMFANATLNGGAADTNWHVLVLVFNGSSSKFYKDGGAATATGNTSNNSSGGITIGSDYNGGSTMNGDINYFALYDGNLIVDDLSTLNDACEALADRAGTTWTAIS